MLLDRWYASVTYRVRTPEGTVFVTVVEHPTDHPISVDIVIGKAGSVLQAWARSVSGLVTAALENGTTLERIIEGLSGQTSDRSYTSSDGITIRSGPEAVAYALMLYKRDRFAAAHVELDDEDEEDDAGERQGRFIRLAR